MTALDPAPVAEPGASVTDPPAPDLPVTDLPVTDLPATDLSVGEPTRNAEPVGQAAWPAANDWAARGRPIAVSWRRLGSVEAVAVVMVAIIAARGWLVGLFDSPQLISLTTVFVSVLIQALPFLILGTALAGAISAFAPAQAITWVHRRDLLGAMLTSPALNPVVVVSTALAFPGEVGFVFARLVAGLAAAAVAAVLWRKLGQPIVPAATPRARGWPAFVDSCREDVVRGGGMLVVGGAAVSVLAVGLPVRWLDTLAVYPAVAIAAAALLAVLLSQRSETDAVLVWPWPSSR